MGPTPCQVDGTAYEDYTSVDVVEKVMEITGGAGCKAVIDGIGPVTHGSLAVFLSSAAPPPLALAR
jgi:threonine dehydrogenase-like Zn-dependent dehydrogenase